MVMLWAITQLYDRERGTKRLLPQRELYTAEKKAGGRKSRGKIKKQKHLLSAQISMLSEV